MASPKDLDIDGRVFRNACAHRLRPLLKMKEKNAPAFVFDIDNGFDLGAYQNGLEHSLSKMSSPQTPCRILNIPQELQDLILSFLDTPRILAMRITCTRFRRLLPQPTHAELIACERTKFAIYKALLCCSDCQCLRPEKEFPWTRNQKSGRYAPIAQKEARICYDCGDKRCHYALPGTSFKIGLDTFVKCGVCNKIEKEQEERPKWFLHASGPLGESPRSPQDPFVDGTRVCCHCTPRRSVAAPLGTSFKIDIDTDTYVKCIMCDKLEVKKTEGSRYLLLDATGVCSACYCSRSRQDLSEDYRTREDFLYREDRIIYAGDLNMYV